MDNIFLTGILWEIADLTSINTALKIAARCGGTLTYIPVKDNNDNWLIDLVGNEDAEEIIKRWGGDTVAIPLGPYGTRHKIQQTIIEGTEEGKSIRTLVKLTGVARATVTRHRRRAKTKPTLPLFEN